MAATDVSKVPRLRDQRLALHAYQAVARVPSNPEIRRKYKIAVNDLGANILRSGLCAAIASVQRLKGDERLVLEHLATAGVPGLEKVKPEGLAERVQTLSTDEYMIATREILQLATWLKRAVQATFAEEAK